MPDGVPQPPVTGRRPTRTPEERAELERKWLEENREAIASYNRWYEENGHPLAEFMDEFWLD